MMSRCCRRPLETIHDGCIKIMKKCSFCQNVYTQPKRRKAGLTLAQCSWMIPCADHPNGGSRRIDIDGESTFIEVQRSGDMVDLTMVNDEMYSSMRLTSKQAQALRSML